MIGDQYFPSCQIEKHLPKYLKLFQEFRCSMCRIPEDNPKEKQEHFLLLGVNFDFF